MIPKEILKKVRRIQIRTSHMVNDTLAGQYQSVFKGQGMEFDEVREYQPGDEIRSIDWNVTARTGHPYVKKFVEERELTVMLMLDASSSTQFGSVNQFKSELAAELCAVLAFSAIKNNDKVGLIIFTDSVEKFIPPKKGRRHVLRVIREALYFKPKHKGTDIPKALEYLNKITTRRTVIFLVSDFLTSDFEKPLRIANKRHDVIALVINDPREAELPAVGIIELVDAETGLRIAVDTSQEKTRKEFKKINKIQALKQRDLFRSANVDAVNISTGVPYMEPLLKFFRIRERRLR